MSTTKKLSTVCLLLVVALVASIGIQIDQGGRPADLISVGAGQEKVIRIGTAEAQAAGTADYAITGVNDNIPIQAALNSLPATGGRLVIVSAVQINFAVSTNVTKAIPNVTIEGTGVGTSFVGDGVTPEFIAGGSNWKFVNCRFDVAPAMGVTTGWQWDNVMVGATLYDRRNPSYSVVGGAVVASSANVTTIQGLDTLRFLNASQLFQDAGSGLSLNHEFDNIVNVDHELGIMSPVARDTKEHVALRVQLQPSATTPVGAGGRPVSSIDADLFIRATNTQNWTNLVSLNAWNGIEVGTTGTIAELITFQCSSSLDAATVTKHENIKIQDSTGAGVIINDYAIWIDPVIKGTTVNEAIHIEGGDSYCGGDIKFGALRYIRSSRNDNWVGFSGGDLVGGGSGATFYLKGKNVVGDPGSLTLYTPDGAGGDTLRLHISGNVTPAVATWTDIVHTGIVLSNNQAITQPDTSHYIELRGGTTTNPGATFHAAGSTSGENGAADVYTSNAAGTGVVKRLSIAGAAATSIATWSNVTHTGFVLSNFGTISQPDNAHYNEFNGGTTSTGSGAVIHAAGYALGGETGLVDIYTPNAAGTGVIKRVSISGAAALGSGSITFYEPIIATGIPIDDPHVANKIYRSATDNKTLMLSLG